MAVGFVFVLNSILDVKKSKMVSRISHRSAGIILKGYLRCGRLKSRKKIEKKRNREDRKKEKKDKNERKNKLNNK